MHVNNNLLKVVILSPIIKLSARFPLIIEKLTVSQKANARREWDSICFVRCLNDMILTLDIYYTILVLLALLFVVIVVVCFFLCGVRVSRISFFLRSALLSIISHFVLYTSYIVYVFVCSFLVTMRS